MDRYHGPVNVRMRGQALGQNRGRNHVQNRGSGIGKGLL